MLPVKRVGVSFFIAPSTKSFAKKLRGPRIHPPAPRPHSIGRDQHQGEEVAGGLKGPGYHACARGLTEKLLQGTE